MCLFSTSEKNIKSNRPPAILKSTLKESVLLTQTKKYQKSIKEIIFENKK